MSGRAAATPGRAAIRRASAVSTRARSGSGVLTVSVSAPRSTVIFAYGSAATTTGECA